MHGSIQQLVDDDRPEDDLQRRITHAVGPQDYQCIESLRAVGDDDYDGFLRLRSVQRQVVSYPSLLGIVRVTSLKVLGVIITNGLLASDHVRGVIAKCAQTLYALRVLRPRHVLFGAADHLPSHHHRSQVAECFQCLMGLHQCDRPAVSQCVLAQQYSLRPMST